MEIKFWKSPRLLPRFQPAEILEVIQMMTHNVTYHPHEKPLKAFSPQRSYQK